MSLIIAKNERFYRIIMMKNTFYISPAQAKNIKSAKRIVRKYNKSDKILSSKIMRIEIKI